MRVEGLRAILGDGQRCDMVTLWPPSAAAAANLALAIVDSSATHDVLEVVVTLRRLRPQLGVIVLGQECEMEHIERVIGSGAKGYLTHSANEAELKMAVEVVLDGSVWAPRKVLARLLDQTLQEGNTASHAFVVFTKREQEVLRLLVLGHPNRQIASLLGVDEGTVKAHMGRLMRKAGVQNRTALSVRAIERQWA
jgi:DNA-binding NarL/FixJ family response regulator